MVYLFIQTWAWILGAGLLGLFIGWLIWGKRNSREDADSVRLKRQLNECRKRCAEWEASVGAAAVDGDMSSGAAITESAASVTIDSGDNNAEDPVPSESEIQDNWKPAALSGPEGMADDLKRVKGIGPVIEKTLNELGIFHFRQVAAFTEENIRWVDNYIAFPGRIQRESWVLQAQKLDGGGETDFSNRYDNN